MVKILVMDKGPLTRMKLIVAPDKEISSPIMGSSENGNLEDICKSEEREGYTKKDEGEEGRGAH
jgi:hypothetical protein